MRKHSIITRHVRLWDTLSKRKFATTSLHSPLPPKPAPNPGVNHSDGLFHYTRGRFVCDEEYEMSQRHVVFNVNELARCAAEAIGAESCVSIEKYPDGMYNKSMLLTMDNGSQVVAKVPNPNAGISHFTTASEVATMDFARNIMGTPVPNVLAWSSRAEENPVGAEYIIMEKAPGIELERVWPSMNIKDRFALVKKLAGFQKSWTSVSFKKYGSLYYANDLQPTGSEPLYIDANGGEIINKKFAIGPSTGRESFDNRRGTVDFDRGPWDSLESYHRAIGQREIACISQIPDLPKSPITLCGPGTYEPTKQKKLRALRCYLKLIRFLLPADHSISSAHLWHGDLHVANIFVNPSQQTEVVSLIDWQSTEMSPLYFQARQPHIINYDGPPVFGLERPQPPKDMEKLEASARKHADILFLQQSLCALYNTLTHHKNPQIYAALEFQQSTGHMLLLLARNLLIDGEASYLMSVLELESTWNTLPGADGSPYPFSFSNKDRRKIEEDVEGVVRGMEAMRSIKDSMGELFPEQGIVRLDRYEEALEAFAQIKEQIIQEFAKTEQDREAWMKAWPFGT